MRNIRRFLVAALVPAMILAIFMVGAVAANGSHGKVEICHWTGHKFVDISVSLNAKPAHLAHGDVEPDEYGDCAGDNEGDNDDGDDGDHDDGDDGDHDDGDDGDHDDGDDHDGGQAHEGGSQGGGDNGDKDDGDKDD